MEPKKNPSKDIYRKSGMFFLVGLCTSITLVICSFEWTTPKIEVERKYDRDDIVMAALDPTIYVTERPTPAPPKNLIKKIPIPISIIETTEPNSNKSDEPEIINPDSSTPTIEVTIPPMDPEDDETPVTLAEKMPVPVGGYESFYRFVSEKLKYPSIAQRNEIQGKVFVEFIINKKGEPQQLKVIKGIGYRCDEEALRVIALTKWEPGKQRGKPVTVKMVLPLQFKLQ